ncbi:hypothetical protein PILCRDRAFT_13354 [Piloderma croceum F 1598]|uniref:DUF6593 domain-containing protein n=1 Tax=Piloderma croceum (strain F 1598) TaxID=765440 RepID=A0A0C3F7A3_PILCF|nr:hypothetical protein PILCRDRAFT_13354 [Piloderma croceum F 1598]
MNLYLTNHANVRNTNFCNADGQVMYRSETAGSVFAPNKVTTIYKIIPNDTLDDMADRFTNLATIAWRNIFTPSRLTYEGLRMPIASKGVFAQHRVFTAPGDGRSFKWTLGVWRVTLNNGSKTMVAQGHRSDIGLTTGRPSQARLEIFPGFEHLVDLILVTYIYAEKIRKTREKAAQKRLD